MAANRIYIQVDFQSENANAKIDELNKNIKTIGSASDQATQQATTGMKSLSVQVEHTATDLQNLAQAIGGLGIAEIGTEAIKAGDELGRLQLALRDLKGEMAGVDTLAKQLRAASENLPGSIFDAKQIMQAGLMLKNYGMDVNQIARNVQNLATVMGSKGLNGDQLIGLVQMLGNLQMGGTVRMQQLTKELASMGLKMTDIFGGKIGQQQLNQMMKQQEINGAGFVDMFFRGINERAQQTDIGPLMAQLTSKFGALKDQADFTSARISKDFQGGPLDKMLDVAGHLLKIFEELPDPVRKFAEGLGLAAASMVIIEGAMKGIELAASGIAAFKGVGTLATRMAAGGAAAGAGAAAEGGAAAAAGAAASTPWGLIATIGVVVTMVAAYTLRYLEQNTSWFKTHVEPGLMGTPLAPLVAGSKLYDWWKGGQPNEAKKEDEVPPFDPNKKGPPLFVPPYNKTLEQLQASKQDLAGAQQQAELQGIASIHTKYQEIYDRLKLQRVTDIRVISNFQQAEAIRVETKIREMQDETTKLHLDNQKTALDQLAKYQETTAKHAADMAGTTPQDTLAKAAEVEAMRQQIVTAGAAEVAETRKETALKEYTQAHNLLERQRDADVGYKKATAEEKLRLDKDVYGPREAELRETMRLKDVQAERDNAETVAQIRIKALEEGSKTATDLMKQTRDEQRQNEITETQHQAQIAKQMIKTGEDQNAAAKVDTIMRVAAIDIQTAQQVSVEKKAIVKQDLKDQEDAATTLQNRYKDDPETARVAGDMRVAAEQKAAADITKIDNDASFEAANYRYQAFHDANEKIIEEQKQVYDKLKSAVGTVWDALFQKGKSVWQALGDAAKKAFMDMAKEIVTSHVAAAMMALFTGQPVAMESRGSFGGPLGKLAGIFTQHPVFKGTADQSQLDKNLADLRLQTGTPGPGTPAIPVVITNQTGGQDPRQVQINHKIDQTVKVTAATAPLAATGLALALKGIGAAGSGSGAGSGGGGDYETSAKMTWEGGGSVDLGGGVGTFGSSSSGGVAGSSGIPGIGAISDAAAASGVPGGAGAFGGFGGGIPGLGSLGSLNSIGTIAKLGQFMREPGGMATALRGLAGPLALTGSIAGLKGAYALGQSTNPLAKAAAIPVGAAAGLLGFGAMAYMFPALVAAGPIGWIAAAAIGAGIGLYGLLHKTDAQKAHDAVQKAYGIDIKNQGVLNAIAQAAKKYGDFNVGIMSPEVQQIIHMYTLSQGINATGIMPRPMYSATLAQSSAAGGLQLQPVYSSGQLVASPYSGATTQQWSQGLYVQLNPQQANDLLTGKIVDAMNNNPGTVASANATGLQSGQGVTAQRNALIEPLTVMS